ncbi:energy-coupling factor transporter ATPase [Aneurinibacillus terranovensis]|uniref:energy-coupling factor transporter ATPase n=1 Tax=Aneurinibacillus terranovensis TaxID=278991 RepID=UPI0003FB42A6
MNREPLIRVDNVSFSYQVTQSTTIPVLQNVSLQVFPGEYLAVVGHNGSGKSTLSKHLNGILTPSAGDVLVRGMNTKDVSLRREIRQCVGMVFQHPDNQIVGTIVEDDVAFGLENIGVPHEEMKARVDHALEAVNMSAFRKRPPHHLSGGQKQRIAIACMIAMAPECLVLDEATSMIDSYGRRDIHAVIDRLHAQGMTIVTVTHHMSEVVKADRVIVMDKGRIEMQGSPRNIFKHHDRLKQLHLDIPEAGKLAIGVHERYPPFAPHLISIEEFIDEVNRVQFPRTEVSK